MANRRQVEFDGEVLTIRWRDMPRWRWYWRLRAVHARVSSKLHGYPPRPPLDDLMGRLAAEHPDDERFDQWRP